MCFSVTASFTASLALITCGAAALNCAREKKLKMFAAIPLLFGLQQFAEGMVWLSFLNLGFESLRMLAAYIFLAFAGVVWPLWIPISIVCVEGESTYKRYLLSLIAGGLCVLTSIAYVLLYPISVEAGCNIIYYFDGAHTHAWATCINVITSLLYIVATIVPFFIARSRGLWFIGALIAISYVVSYVVYLKAFTSVWCFFAALISMLVYKFVRDYERHRII